MHLKNESILIDVLPKLERYLQWNLDNRRHPNRYLMYFADACEAGMDNEQTYCPGEGEWCCASHHYAIDFTATMAFECEYLARIAHAAGTPPLQPSGTAQRLCWWQPWTNICGTRTGECTWIWISMARC